jgi:hypothetical protein
MAPMPVWHKSPLIDEAGANPHLLLHGGMVRPSVIVPTSVFSPCVRERSPSCGRRAFYARSRHLVLAIVTPRLRPFALNGKTVHGLGMPWHFNWQGLAAGVSANFVTPMRATATAGFRSTRHCWST